LLDGKDARFFRTAHTGRRGYRFLLERKACKSAFVLPASVSWRAVVVEEWSLLTGVEANAKTRSQLSSAIVAVRVLDVATGKALAHLEVFVAVET
jgi:hypothetical protein